MGEVVAKYFLLITGIGTFLYYVIKLAINKFMEAGLEQYKARLSIDLETHKAELSKITLEHKTRFEYLHPERLKAIKDLHNKICECEDKLSHLTTQAQGSEWTIDNQRQEETLATLESFKGAIRATKLYLEPSLTEKLESLYRFSWEIVTLMRKARREHKSNQQVITEYRPELEERLRRPFDNWVQADKMVKDDFVKIRTEVENEFRRLLDGLREY